MTDFFSIVENEEAKWKHIVEGHIGSNANMLACSQSSTNRRVYKAGESIYKIVLINEAQYANTLEQEFRLLSALSDIDSLPKVISFENHCDCSILETKLYHALKVGQIGDQISRHKLSIKKLVRAIYLLNIRGVRHGDITIHNILISPDGELKIVDLDQACETSRFQAILGDFFGIGKYPAKRTLIRLLTQLILSRMPLWCRSGMIHLARQSGKRLVKRLKYEPSICPDTHLGKIWSKAMASDANAPGQGVSYYSLRMDKHIYPGERPWEPRWESILSIVNFKNKRILELGCNMGFLSCYMERYGSLPNGLGVDHDKEIINTAKEFSLYAGAKTSYRVVDFNATDSWENTFDVKQFQMVTALSVLNWVSDKGRFLRFLGSFQEVLYEGHDEIGIECSRLQSAGFKYIDVVSVSERQRAVLWARKVSLNNNEG